MTLEFEPDPIAAAVLFGGVGVVFLGLSVVLAAHYAAKARRAAEPAARRDARVHAIKMSLCGLFVIGFYGLFWFAASPHSVVLGEDAMHLRYVWSTRRVPYDSIGRIEFDAYRSRHVERQRVKVFVGDATFYFTSEVQPSTSQAVRTLFAELTRRAPHATVPADSTTAWERKARQAERRGY